MDDKEYKGYTPDYIDRLLPSQIFVFGSNTLGYHTGGASGTARKKFGAVWGQAEGLQGQSYAIPVDYGKGILLIFICCSNNDATKPSDNSK